MNDSLRKNLDRARRALLDARSHLAVARRADVSADALEYVEGTYCAALDRLWEAQCMAGGSL